MTAAELTSLQTLVLGGWLIQVVQSIVILVVALVVARLALNWSGAAMRRARVDTGTEILVKRGIVVAFVVATSLIVLGILGVSTASLVTVVGAVGLAFSLAIQDILKNFFSGVYLLLERPFRVGDTIRVKEQQGVVENIGVRTTMLRTPDNVQVLVPNVMVFGEVVTNHSHARPATPAVLPGDGHPAVSTEPATDASAATAGVPADVAGAATTGVPANAAGGANSGRAASVVSPGNSAGPRA